MSVTACQLLSGLNDVMRSARPTSISHGNPPRWISINIPARLVPGYPSPCHSRTQRAKVRAPLRSQESMPSTPKREVRTGAAASSDAMDVLLGFGTLMLRAGNTATRTREWIEAIGAQDGLRCDIGKPVTR